MARVALELDKVSAGYGETVVLEDIGLQLEEGETISLIGRNGVGKTTLLATVMGHNTLHGGDVRLHGKTIARLAAHRRNWAGLGYVPQEREIFPSLTLRENLEVAARPGARAGAWTLDKVFALFPRLAERQGNRGNQLSGGEQQMLAIARALIGLTMILVEQNTRLALDISPRTAVLDRGRIVYDGPSETLKRDPDRLHRLIGVGKG
jgi:branched-chain amino acid transport system ATP-binding protein